jgi:hypothetical protein
MKLFCYALTENEWVKNYASASPPMLEVRFDPNRFMGATTVGNLLKFFLS